MIFCKIKMMQQAQSIILSFEHVKLTNMHVVPRFFGNSEMKYFTCLYIILRLWSYQQINKLNHFILFVLIILVLCEATIYNIMYARRGFVCIFYIRIRIRNVYFQTIIARKYVI